MGNRSCNPVSCCFARHCNRVDVSAVERVQRTRWKYATGSPYYLSDVRCPRCGAGVRDVEGVAFCDSCGLVTEANRVPLYWVLKRWREAAAALAPG
ncbi:MAG: hypothetical protein QXP31_02170 [Pyrobaculum sp.]